MGEDDSAPSCPVPPARGWYRIPDNPNYEHFWDGQKWTSQRYWGGASTRASPGSSAPCGGFDAAGSARASRWRSDAERRTVGADLVQFASYRRRPAADSLLRRSDDHRTSCIYHSFHLDHGIFSPSHSRKTDRHWCGRTRSRLRPDLFSETLCCDRAPRRIAHVQSSHRLKGDGDFADHSNRTQDRSPRCIILDLRIRWHQGITRGHWRQRTRSLCNRTQPCRRAPSKPIFLGR